MKSAALIRINSDVLTPRRNNDNLCYLVILFRFNLLHSNTQLLNDLAISDSGQKECLMDISCKGFLSLESEYALLVLDCNTVALSQSSLENLHYV